MILEILVLLVLIISYIFYMRGVKSYSDQYTFGDYEITITDNRYCQMSHIGILRMKIRQTNGQDEKLFSTSDDIINDRSSIIVDKSGSLRVGTDSYYYESEAYEKKYQDGIQYIDVYYVNQDVYGRFGELRLEIENTQGQERLFRKTVGTERDERGKELVFHDQKVYVTNNGIMLDASGEQEIYNSISMITGIMEIQWKNRSEEVALRSYAETANYSSPYIIRPQIKVNTGNRKSYYAVEFEDWEDIEKVKIGTYIYEPKE